MDKNKIQDTKYKILHLITGLEVGGTEKALLRTVPHLTDFEHIFCALKGTGEVAEALRQMGFKVYNLNGGGAFRLLPSIKAFQEIIRQEKPDILITYLPLADIFGRILGRIFGIRIIITYIRSRGRERKYWKAFIAEILTSWLVTRYLAISETVKNFYVKSLLIPENKITVIPNGIDVNQFKASPQSVIKRYKKELGIRPKNLVIGTVSVLRPEKGIKLLIEAFAQVNKSFNETKLIIVGEGQERKKLENLRDKLGLKEKVQFLGYRRDVTELLHIFDIFVLPSIYEGMSNTILEAMAAKRAIVASGIPENRELVQNKKEGLLVPSQNSKLLATATIQLLGDKVFRNKLGRAAYQKVKNKFDLKETASMLQMFFDQITKRNQ